jgi:hypothetical protein
MIDFTYTKNTIYRALDITDTVCTVNKNIEGELL